jgi:hypothetical protein
VFLRRQQRRWVSLEARSLLECTGLDDPVAAIRKLVDGLLKETEQKEAPINLPVVASFRGVVEIRAERMIVAAMLVPISEGLRILVNIADPQGRRNFSIAHEICHTLFPNYASNPVARIDKVIGQFSMHQEEEYLCDIGASHLLLPPSLLLPKIVSYGPCLDAILQLAEEFQTSLEAAAIAWAEASPWPYAVIFLEENLKPSEMKRKNQLILPGMEDDFRLEPALRIALACASSNFPFFLPKHKSVARDGPIYQALATQSRTSGKEVLNLGGDEKGILSESLYAPYWKRGVLQHRVVSLVSLQ